MEIYSDSQIRGVLQDLGISITSHTNQNYLGLCPFHNNRNTASFSVSRKTGQFICYNPACGAKGGIRKLIMKLGDKDYHQAGRVLRATEEAVDYTAAIQAQMEAKEFPEFDQAVLEGLHENLWEKQEALEYLHGRGLSDDTIKYFGIGYSQKQDMVTFPMHDFRGTPVGLVGRSLVGKTFNNSAKLPKHETFWNLHRVRGYDEVIIVESCIDAMLLHQAGHPNVVALLGGTLSDEHVQLLNRYFEEYTLAVDNDEGGRALASDLRKRLSHKIIKSVSWPYGVKDVGSLDTDEERNDLIESAKTMLERKVMV